MGSTVTLIGAYWDRLKCVRPPLEWLDQNERDFIQELIMSI